MANEDAGPVVGFVEEAKGAFSARLRNPFVGVFIFSWLAWNHRLLFVLFSDMKVGKRFDFIDNDLYVNAWHFWSWNLCWPLLSALAYILIVPWLTELVHTWNLWHQRRLKARDLRSENYTLLTLEQSFDLKSLLGRKNAEITDLKIKLEGGGRDVARLQAMHTALLEPRSDAADGAIGSFLLSDVFSIRLLVEMGGEISVHHFSKDGTLYSIRVHRDRAVMAEQWSLHKGEVFLKSAAGEVLASFTFNPNNAQFEGKAGGRGAYMNARSR